MEALGHTLLSFVVLGFLPGALVGVYWGRAQKIRAALFALFGGLAGMAAAFSLSGYALSMELPILRSPVAMVLGALGASALLMTIIGKAEYRPSSYDD